MAAIHETIFNIGLLLSYVLYFFAFFKIGVYEPKYLDNLEQFLKYYVIGFLLIRFNPLSKPVFTEFDRRVVFSSAIFLLTTTAITQYSQNLDMLELVKYVRIFI
jgi:hypothetical protein